MTQSSVELMLARLVLGDVHRCRLPHPVDYYDFILLATRGHSVFFMPLMW